MLTPLTIRQQQLIVASLRKVFQTGDINNLSKSAYNFLYQSSGFIAHFNLYGFRDRYKNVDDLKRAIARNYGANQWRNFGGKDPNHLYMMSKRDCYNNIAALVEADGYELNRGFW